MLVFLQEKEIICVKISGLSKIKVVPLCDSLLWNLNVFCSTLACRQKLLDAFSITGMVLNYHISNWHINSYFIIVTGGDSWDAVQRFQFKSHFMPGFPTLTMLENLSLHFSHPSMISLKSHDFYRNDFFFDIIVYFSKLKFHRQCFKQL